MAMYVVKKCPHCGVMYKHGHDTRSLGRPFLLCDVCKGAIVDEDTTEWALKSASDKVIFVLLCSYSALLLGMIAPLVWMAVLYFQDKQIEDSMFVRTYLGGVLFFMVLTIFGLIGEVKESNKRMQDPAYRQMLRHLRLLKEP